ncbi:MAG: hypothetical protein EBU90_23450, partial [Proteobacteria bacterium]|nr:hypothetical protein [Pseudomonadota bacterium]
MMCYFHYFGAKARLREIKKTVRMLASDDFSENDVPPMILAQKDFDENAVEYFRDECVRMNYKLLISILIAV